MQRRYQNFQPSNHSNCPMENSQSKVSKKSVILVLTLVFVVLAFMLSSYLVNMYGQTIENSISDGFWGISLFLVINIIAVVLAPFTTLPLVPVATAIWGWFWTGIFLIISWTIGSQIAFYLSRRFGPKLVSRFVNTDKLYW